MRLITFIASHIDSTKRLNNFIKLVASINGQIDYFDEIEVIISMSHDNSVSREEINFLFNSANKKNFKIHYHDNVLRQFEHYKFLSNEYAELDENETWILFSDDDDKWSENRLAAYHYMINCVGEKKDEYDLTTSICYTSQKNKPDTNYVGSYIDYCVKFKYLKIFFANASEQQLKHKFCDCYFVKFLCTYGSGKLKRAFCATDDILYDWIKREEKNEPKINLKNALTKNLDLFIAQYTKPTAQKWIKFCDMYSKNKISNNEVPDELKRYIIILYMNNYQDHIFADKHIPVYTPN